ncbi:MAG: bifunctional 3-(3-hydroxy-phenyl)propionate/3-hydroxycinnamic acid hydroxylase [Pseudomonadales bacterium]|jgi:3-(3-hydroxy-phenyl)propionate hydroxylase
MADTYDIAIVGMGPVGCAAAILFSHNGLRVVCIERDLDVYSLPRAVAMDGEIVRAFQAVGLGQQLDDLLQTVREGDRAGFANSKREWLFGHDMADGGSNGWQPLSMFDQPEVETFLRSQAINHPNVTSYIGYEFESFDDHGDQVHLKASQINTNQSENARSNRDGVIDISARYVLACDGANSKIRRTLNIEWDNLGYDHDWLVVDIIIKDGHTLNNDTVQVCDPDRITTYVVTKDPYRRWEFKLNPGETWDEMLQVEKIEQLIEPWTPKGSYEIRRSAVYQFHAATAKSWRVGNVFIAGDAAHQTPPFLGQGMNAGMRDAINLAWKFQMVIKGEADESLLDAYQQERLPHAQDLVEWAVDIGQLMEHLAAVEDAERNGKAVPEAVHKKKSSGYGQGRSNPPLRDGVLMLGQVDDTGSSGYLFSQPLVQRGGKAFKLDEELGRGFSIVAKSESDIKLNKESRRIIDRFGITVSSLEGLELVKGKFDNLFKNANAAIIRPDHYVFGHTTNEITLDDLLRALSSTLASSDTK